MSGASIETTRSTGFASALARREGVRVRRARSQRWLVALAALLSLVLLGADANILVDASRGSTSNVPYSPPIAGWLAKLGIGEPLRYSVLVQTLLVSSVAYVGLILLVRSRRNPISARWGIGLVATLELIVFVAPVLFATDIFNYIDYARLAVLHGVNPYVHGPAAAASDPFYRYISSDWIHWPTPYGPLFTLVSYAAAPLGVDGAVWAMKAEALLASAGTLALTWRCARARGLDPVAAIVVVGLNPFYLLYTLGGSHNDLTMMFAMMAGVSLTLADGTSARRQAAGAAAVVAGVFVKATAAVMLPFMIVSQRRLAPIVGALGALAVGVIVGYAAFGLRGIDVVAELNRQDGLVSSHSFADRLAYLFGASSVSSTEHTLLTVGLAAILLYLLWRTWQGYDWIAATGWALLAIAVTTTWLMAWYTVWPLPLAVISRDRRLLVSTLCIQLLWL